MNDVSFKRGDYVVYTNGTKRELGRVVGSGSENSRVCYSHGCTSASTPNRCLRIARESELAGFDPDYRGIGYHRFDESCPDIDMGCCYADCIGKAKVLDGTV